MYNTLEATDLMTCKHCGKKGYLTYQHWPGTPDLIHCNKCGCSWEVKQKEEAKQ